MRAVLSCLLLLGSAAAAQPPAAPRKLSEPEAARLLKAAVRIDSRAAAVLKRSAAAYRRLKSLQTESTVDGVKTITRLKRPNYLHSLQHRASGELIRLSISDGRHYYDYSEAVRKYVQRSASVLSSLALPVNARPFFVDVAGGAAMKDLKGVPAVREYAFTFAGEERVGSRVADRIRVSTVARVRDGWSSFESVRLYDRESGLLVQVRSRNGRTSFKNTPNASLPTEGFVWKPIPGGTRSFE